MGELKFPLVDFPFIYFVAHFDNVEFFSSDVSSLFGTSYKDVNFCFSPIKNCFKGTLYDSAGCEVMLVNIGAPTDIPDFESRMLSGELLPSSNCAPGAYYDSRCKIIYAF